MTTELTKEALRGIERSATLRTIAANLVGVVLFFLGSALFVPVQLPDLPLGRAYLFSFPISAAFFILAALHVIRRFNRRYSVATAWVAENRRPTREEVGVLVSLPRRTSFHVFVYWVVASISTAPLAALVFGGWVPPLVTVKGFAAVLVAGVPSAVMSHLLIERAIRPLRALALSNADEQTPHTMGMLARLLLAWLVGSGIPLALIAFQMVGLDSEQLQRSVPLIWISCGLAVVMGVTLMAFSARAITDPIHRVRAGLSAVGTGDLDPQIAVDEAGELGQLQTGFNEMVAGLRDRERLRDLFGRHVGPEVAAKALSEDPRLDGETRAATAMFVDVIGSTPLAESLPPRDVLAKLNLFFEVVVRHVTTEGGLVNQFQGDGAVCIFGAPLAQDDHAARALCAARSLHADLSKMHGIEAAIGISSGPVVAGNVGTIDRHAYTVIGDPVNEASRLCDAAKETDTKILVAGSTIEIAGASGGAWDPADSVLLRGRTQLTQTFTTRPT